MRFRMTPGNPSVPAALWLGVWRKASYMMAGVIHPKIIGVDIDRVGWDALAKEKGPPGGAWGPKILPQFLFE